MKSLDIPSMGTKIDYITISYTGGQALGRLNRSSIHTVTFPYGAFAQRLRAIHRAGGRVIGVSTEQARSEVILPEVTIAKTNAQVAIAEESPASVPTSPTSVEVSQVITEPVAGVTTEVITEPVIEPVTEQVVEPVVEPVAEIIAEQVIEPIVESVIEPVTETIAEPVTEQVIEQSVTEPEPTVKPKKSRASSKSGGFAKPKVDTAPAKATRSPRKPKS